MVDLRTAGDGVAVMLAIVNKKKTSNCHFYENIDLKLNIPKDFYLNCEKTTARKYSSFHTCQLNNLTLMYCTPLKLRHCLDKLESFRIILWATRTT